MASLSAKTVPGVLKKDIYAMRIRIAQMGVMRVVLIAETNVRHYALWVIHSSHVTRAVAFGGPMPAALRLNPSVKMAETWLTLSAMASVILHILELRTRIGGLVPMAPRNVSSRRLAVMGIQIVTMPAMSRIVLWSPRLA